MAKAKKALADAKAKLKGTEADAKETYDRLKFDLAEAEDELTEAKKALVEAKAKAVADAKVAEAKAKVAKAKAVADAKAAISAEANDDVDRLKNDLVEAKAKAVADAKVAEAEAKVAKAKAVADAKAAISAEANDDVDRLKNDLVEAKAKAVADAKVAEAEAKVAKAKAVADAKAAISAEAKDVVETLQRQLLMTPMIHAAYSGMDSAVLARPGVLTGIGDPTISPLAGEPESGDVKYDEDDRPQFQMYDAEGSLTNVFYRSVPTPIGGGYDGYRFEGQTEQSRKTHVVLYTDKRFRKVNYLTYGVWLTVPVVTTDMHPVGAYASGGDPFMGNVENLTGEATYKGPAVGIYGERAVDSKTSAVGSFTADASLTANFDDYSVSGYVTEFMENGDELGWMVRLDYEGAPGPKFGGETQISKTANGDNMKGKGMWTGQFYGNGKADDYPGSVAGTFNARTGNPADVTKHYLGIVGAFGAKLQQQPAQ